MSGGFKATRVTIMPTMRYDDAAAAIEWLCGAFGFEKHMVIPGENGDVVHAQLTFGNGMVMLSSSRDDRFGELQTTPRGLGGATTQSCYLVVADIDAHHARSTAAGAEIVMPLEDQGHGKMYSCRDPEGHLWNFGDYDPWVESEGV